MRRPTFKPPWRPGVFLKRPPKPRRPARLNPGCPIPVPAPPTPAAFRSPRRAGATGDPTGRTPGGVVKGCVGGLGEKEIKGGDGQR